MPVPPAPSTSYFGRLRQDGESQAKLSTAHYVAHHFGGDTSFFIGAGTAAAMAGIELLARRKHHVRLRTHLAPLAWHVMHLVQAGLLPADLSLTLCSGDVNLNTGVIGHRSITADAEDILIYSPHGIGLSGVSANRDVETTLSTWKAHQRVILVATHFTFLRPTATLIRSDGKLKGRDLKERKHVYDLVVPSQVPQELDKEERAKVQQRLEYCQEEWGFTIHRSPAPPKDMLSRQILI